MIGNPVAAILNITLWELFKRLLKPQTLTKLINRHGGEEGLRRLLAETASESGEAGIRAAAEGIEKAEACDLKASCLNSSNINKIRYDDESSTMTVVFNSGAAYEYYDVPRQVASDFISWPGSKGQWFAEHIRGGTPTIVNGKRTVKLISKTHSNYAYAKVGAEPTQIQGRQLESGWTSTHYPPR
jgi:hypothetical protein